MRGRFSHCENGNDFTSLQGIALFSYISTTDLIDCLILRCIWRLSEVNMLLVRLCAFVVPYLY